MNNIKECAEGVEFRHMNLTKIIFEESEVFEFRENQLGYLDIANTLYSILLAIDSSISSMDQSKFVLKRVQHIVYLPRQCGQIMQQRFYLFFKDINHSVCISATQCVETNKWVLNWSTSVYKGNDQFKTLFWQGEKAKEIISEMRGDFQWI
jgi:hypothetical protein